MALLMFLSSFQLPILQRPSLLCPTRGGTEGEVWIGHAYDPRRLICRARHEQLTRETLYLHLISVICDRSVDHMGLTSRHGTAQPDILPGIFRTTAAVPPSRLLFYYWSTPQSTMFASLLGVPSHSGGSSSSKAHKHASRRSTSSTSTTSHSKPKPSRSAQQRSVAPGTASASFLFVVNELQVDYEPASPQEQPLTDQWLNTMPPQHASAYVGELVGTVFRYRDGVVSPAHGYLWWVKPQPLLCYASLFLSAPLFPLEKHNEKEQKKEKKSPRLASSCFLKTLSNHPHFSISPPKPPPPPPPHRTPSLTPPPPTQAPPSPQHRRQHRAARPHDGHNRRVAGRLPRANRLRLLAPPRHDRDRRRRIARPHLPAAHVRLHGQV